jgi:hypothetical protein
MMKRTVNSHTTKVDFIAAYIEFCFDNFTLRRRANYTKEISPEKRRRSF